MNFRDVIGYGNSASHTGVIDTVTSIMGYIKQIITQLLTGVGTVQIKATTIDLNQGAGTYDLFTCSTQDVLFEGLAFKMPSAVTAGALTSISVQSNYATNPDVLISSTLGAIVNLTANAKISWSDNCGFPLEVGQKIQLTIGGGATGVACVAKVKAKYRAITAGGTL